MLMNEERTAFKNPGLQDDDEEPIHRFYCTYCGHSTIYTDQEYSTALFPIHNIKCNCGHTLYHQREYRQKKWIDKTLRSK